MLSQVLVSSSIIKAQDILDVKRPIANFHPSIWEGHFLSLSSDELKVDDEIEEQAKQLKDKVMKIILTSFVGNPLEKLKLIDSIQRLGVSYHFKNEIDQILEQLYMAYYNDLSSNNSDEDLNTLSLLFRLLRQQGYKISPDMFAKFIESSGKFKESLASDVRGILSLYEAAHMRIHGEEVLEDALDFTIRHLEVIATTSSHRFNVEVSDALAWPLRKVIPRLKARDYMLIYQDDPSHNHTLLTFSKLDFNVLRKLHRKELSEISRWWKDLNFTTKLSFARNRIVEGYFWVLGIQYEPQFSTARKMMTKVFVMISTLDDLYDAYGTYEELKLLTCAIQRWDISMVEQLPEYMKVYYKTLLDVYEEVEKELCKNERSYCIHVAKEKMMEQARFYLAEVEWLHKGHKPTLEEYLEVALETSGGSFFIIATFIGMGEAATMEVFEWVGKNPKVVKATNLIARLMNDIASYEFERERKHIISTVECYMEKYGCSKDEARVELYKQVEDAWKDLNEACLYPTEIPMVLYEYILNFSRVIHFIYKNEEDGYTDSNGATKTYVQSLLIDPMPY